MSDQELRGGFFPSEDQYIDENRVMGSRGTADYDVPIISDQLSSWLQNAPTFPSNSIEEAHEGYSNMLNGLSSFEVPSSLPSEQMNPGEMSRSEEIILSGLEKGQSSGPKRTRASDSLEMQTKETDLQEDSAKEDPQTSDGCKPQKRTRSAEVHNLNERLRRQKHGEKMKALRELIPNSNKRDKASTLDDAIKYIKTLQHQVQEHQMMRIGANYSTFQYPLTMMQQPGQQGMQVPNTLPSCLQICPPRDGRTTGMEYEIGMRTSGMFSPFNFPMSQLGLPNNPCLLPSSSATSGLPAPDGISAATADHSIQNPENVLEALLYATSFPSSESQSTTRGESSSSQGAK